MEIKLLLALCGGLLIVGSFLPYILDIIKGNTEPHVYTWCIWTFTHGIAALAIVQGDGGLIAALSIGAGAVCSFVVFLLSIRQTTQHITTFDSIALAVAVLAIIAWLKLDHPVWVVILITIVDVLGFVPTWRKTWHKPKTESVIAWSLYAIGCLMTLIALSHYNVLTTFYISAMVIASSILVIIITLRRRNQNFDMSIF